MNVLVAEDERVTRHLLEQYLDSWGLKVTAASDGGQAWEFYQSGDFELVISDWNMPEMNGLQLVKRIREHVRGQYAYVILLTARSEKADLVNGLDAGADDFLSKPFDRNELRARLRAGQRIISLQRTLNERNRSLQQANERMEKDLAAAARLQQSLLPEKLPESKSAKFAWSFRPCEELAGDNLNVFQLDSHHIGMYVADVSGHGVAAALLSVTISQLLSPKSSQHGLLVQPDAQDTSKRIVSSPGRVVSELNRRFPIEEFDGNYFTIVYGVLDTRTSVFRYVSAGHPPIILISGDGQPQFIENTGFPIGWVQDHEYAERTLQLAVGDRLCIYSDGLPEAQNVDDEQFGDRRLLESLIGTVSQSLDNSVAQAMLTIESWCGTHHARDDMSMLAIQITD